MRKIEDKYELIEKIDEGGTAEVWKARHMLGDFPCAVKIMKISRSLFEACRNEYKKLCQLSHPNIVRTYELDYIEESGLAYMSMELIRGKTWDSIIEEKLDFTAQQCIDSLTQMVNVLAYLHSGIGYTKHQDIKPSNIMVEGNKTYLIDFNLADNSNPDLGTAPYKCPLVEQNREWTRYADIWALAVSWYELITQNRLFNFTDAPKFVVPNKSDAVIDIPENMVGAICNIINGEGQDTTPECYRSLFSIPHQTSKIAEIPEEIQKHFNITSRNQQFLTLAMLNQENPRVPRSKNVLIKSALHERNLPAGSDAVKKMRRVFSELKSRKIIIYTGKGSSKAVLTDEFTQMFFSLPK